MRCSFTLVLLSLLGSSAQAQLLYVVPDSVETRWASPENPGGERGKGAATNGGRKGSAFFELKAGEQRTLAEVKSGSGMVRRIWMTLNDRSPKMLRGLRLDMYWDGAKQPAVSAPLGDFFGVGLGQIVPFQSAIFSSPEGRSFNGSVPMPFRNGMRIVLTNESGSNQPQVYYDIDYTLGDRHPPDALYFHAYFRRENPTKLQHDYEILPQVTGRGRYLGANIGMPWAPRIAFVEVYLNGGDLEFIPLVQAELTPLDGGSPESRSFVAVARTHVQLAFPFETDG